jgi:poly-beta-1,6-N-acetyl-D-glucosamine N-deacetylase
LLNRPYKFYVLAYHQIKDSANFEKQLIFLKSNFNIIGYPDLYNHFNKNLKLPRKSLLLTFDDGDLTNYTNAFPLMKKHGFPAIFFVITGLINSNIPYWWEELEYYLGKEEGNRKTWELKSWPNKEREEFLNHLRNNSHKPPLTYKQLETSQLQEMSRKGMVIANHSHTHPMFNKCSTDELNDELKSSMRFLKDSKFHAKVFAYPNGSYSNLSEKLLKEHDIESAFLFDHKINNGNINPLRISRLIVNDNTPLWKLKLILSGWHSRILPISKAVNNIRKKLS